MKSLVKKIKKELNYYGLIIKDKRTPRPAKYLLGMAITYAASPIDLIPDFIPVIGYIDDIIIVPTLFFAAMAMIPKEVINDCRKQSEKTSNPYDS